MNKNVFVVVDFDGEMHPYIAEDLLVLLLSDLRRGKMTRLTCHDPSVNRR